MCGSLLKSLFQLQEDQGLSPNWKSDQQCKNEAAFLTVDSPFSGPWKLHLVLVEFVR